jgi:hypothetical protein
VHRVVEDLRDLEGQRDQQVLKEYRELEVHKVLLLYPVREVPLELKGVEVLKEPKELPALLVLLVLKVLGDLKEIMESTVLRELQEPKEVEDHKVKRE